MKNFRRDFERFCYRHQNQGIPNLMLYLAIGTAVVYLFGLIDPSGLLYSLLRFDRAAILRGQIWRLVTYVIVPTNSNILFLAISLYFYYYIGRMIESFWGPFRFNLFYLCGVLLMDVGAILLGANANVSDLNLSLLLAFATLFPENRVLIMYIIPIKMKYLAWFYFVMVIFEVFSYPFPYNLYPLVALLNYFLFFGSDILHILPDILRPKRRNSGFGDFGRRRQKPNRDWAKNYRSKSGEQPYRHKCTVCGRTDVTDPELEFRYCSRCNGYYCYCADHINDHAHIQ